MLKKENLTKTKMLVISCKECGLEVIVEKDNHWPRKEFCSKRCKSRFASRREKAERKRKPTWICYRCGEVWKLSFAPVIEDRRWREFKCPKCGFVPCTRDEIDRYEMKKMIEDTTEY